jgi:serine/threonine protein kinase
MEITNKPTEKPTKIKILSQGSYGCIFRPGITCDKKPLSNQYISKLQRKKKTSENETLLGKTIQKIPHFEDYFAPIIESCEISLTSVDDNEITKCAFVEKDKTENQEKYEDENSNKTGAIPNANTQLSYETNKIRYVGKETLLDYFLNTFKKNPKNTMKNIITTNIDLLDGLNKLETVKIIHLDLKENNIMIDDKSKRPIIIDFGLSFDDEAVTIVNPSSPTKNDIEKLRKVFFTYGPDYAPWCIDICFLTYICNLVEDPIQEKILINNIENIMQDFFIKNETVKEILSEVEKSNYKTELMKYFMMFENKPWIELIKELLNYKYTWDNYSLCVIYLYVLKYLSDTSKKINSNNENLKVLDEYKKIITQQVISIPSKRLSSIQLKDSLKTLFKNINRKDHIEMKTKIEKILKNADKINTEQEISSKIKTKQINELKNEINIYMKKLA